jgi:hypothetical protein
VSKVSDFAFTIGYDGPQAVVDSRAERENAGLGPMELFQKGSFRAAFAAVLKSDDGAVLGKFMDAFNALAGTSFKTREEFSRLFGVYPQDSAKVKRL